MNAIDLLVGHHRRLEDLFEKAMDATEDSERGRCFTEAADLLMAHMTIEERHFYPAVKAKRTEDVLLEGLEEHLSLKRVLADLVEMTTKDEKFEPKLHVLKEQAEHHHEEEEEHLFPKVKKLFDEETLTSLGAEMEATMKELAQKKPREAVLGQTEESAELPDGEALTTREEKKEQEKNAQENARKRKAA
ncbi:hemerythrin domain-containing protein [Chondromyces apiculatus]|uniref:Hemerythrin HHE cation binding domain protein n=1 Tax=Chondromyces apiculatus DSM 436 TaxID=1192034 RepID=A0A017TIY8_9BACT|nr:hemerythrin domain-containing protein [Chondromyces apiculatus]EYF08815.1 Hemerythrin HHE cation binding domain protein [Chondromyces apiculatus DSM 436]